jgi:hypothetical protein
MYIISFGSYSQQVLTRGMAEQLARELIDSDFEGCRSEGNSYQDLISIG